MIRYSGTRWHVSAPCHSDHADGRLDTVIIHVLMNTFIRQWRQHTHTQTHTVYNIDRGQNYNVTGATPDADVASRRIRWTRPRQPSLYGLEYSIDLFIEYSSTRRNRKSSKQYYCNDWRIRIGLQRVPAFRLPWQFGMFSVANWCAPKYAISRRNSNIFL